MKTLGFIAVICTSMSMGPIVSGSIVSRFMLSAEKAPQELVASPTSAHSIEELSEETARRIRHLEECITNQNKHITTLASQKLKLTQELRLTNSRIDSLQSKLQHLLTQLQPQPTTVHDQRLVGFIKEIEAFICGPRHSFNGLAGTLSSRQQEVMTHIVKRSKGQKPPELASGFLLHGPPGNGKSRYAEALADAAQYNFCPVSGGYFNTGYAGDGVLRVLAMEQCARKHSRTVFFIDELDAMAKKRSDLGGGSAAASMIGTMSELWKIIKPIQQSHPHVVFIAATNLLEDCEKALTNRFQERIEFDYPSVEQMDIARLHHLRKHECSLEADITWPYHSMPEESPKLSFRDIEFLVTKIRDFAYLDDTTTITQAHVDKAWGRVLEKKKQDNKPSEEEKRRQREIKSHEWQKQGLALQQQTLNMQTKSNKLQKEALAIQRDACSLQYHGLGPVAKGTYHTAKLVRG